jgi:hypothetical protein
VVWSHNTTISRSTGFTPLKLLYGDKAITPEEAKAGSIRTAASEEDEADYHVAKDTIEGTRLQALENINKNIIKVHKVKFDEDILCRSLAIKDILAAYSILISR